MLRRRETGRALDRAGLPPHVEYDQNDAGRLGTQRLQRDVPLDRLLAASPGAVATKGRGVSIKFAIQFGLMSAMAMLGAIGGVSFLPWQILLLWVALSFAVVALAYATGRPRLLMKRDDGSQPLIAWFILWPYFLLARLSFLLYRLSSRGRAPMPEVMPGVWFSRRLTKRELRESGVSWSAVLDLAAEFPRMAPPDVSYRALHMLDGAVPSEAQLREAAAWLDEHAATGKVLVHCALGHGRSGSVVIAWMLLHRHTPDAQAGVAHLLARRSTFGISKGQLQAVEQLAAPPNNLKS